MIEPIDAEIERLEEARRLLGNVGGKTKVDKPTGKRAMSPETRARMAAAQKVR
jgi:hypothetical protein